MWYLVYALLLRTKMKHCFWNEILFIRDIESLNGDGNFIFILYFSTSPASQCLSPFFFVLFFFLPSFLESTCQCLLRESFERRSCIISLLVFVVAFLYTILRYNKVKWDQYQQLGTDPYIKLPYNFNKTLPYITRHCYIATVQRYNQKPLDLRYESKTLGCNESIHDRYRHLHADPQM